MKRQAIALPALLVFLFLLSYYVYARAPLRVAVVPEASPHAAAAAQARAAGWSPRFSTRYDQQCGHWLSALAALPLTTDKAPAAYACVNPAMCQGLGDRLSGMQGVFNIALQTKRPFRADWAGLSDFFAPSGLLPSPMLNWTLPLPSTDECVSSHAAGLFRSSCADAFTFEAQCASSVVFKGLNRACLTDDTCAALQRTAPELNGISLHGCTLRAMMEPTHKFTHEHLVPLVQGRQTTMMTIAKAQAVLARYHVISIHMRMGDATSFGVLDASGRPVASVFARPKSLEYAQATRAFRCAATLQAHLETRPVPTTAKPLTQQDVATQTSLADDAFTVRGRPVRWFLATDSSELKELALSLYGDKLLMLGTPPKHIAHVSGSAAATALANTLAEWYLLGLGDELVLNRFAHGSKILWRGRVSSFPKTTWAYQLKHVFYDAGTCRALTMPLDGTWTDAPPACQRGFDAAKRARGQSQPHLDGLPKPFPRAWRSADKTFVNDDA